MTKALIISANFYNEVSSNLQTHAISCLQSNGCTYKVMGVPGIFEIPGILSFFARQRIYDVYVILGCVIRGETSHYDHITQEVFRAITDLIIKYQLASGTGIVTAENYEQAVVRSASGEDSSGFKAAEAALHMMGIYRSV